MKPIAVIMSIYKNDKVFIVREAINSILTQTYSKFDLYIQYDGYVQNEIDDFLLEINDDRLIINRRLENRGLAYSLNELLGRILPLNKYEYIARMDADDISFSDRFEKQIDFLEMNKHVDCLGSWAVEIKQNGDEYFKKQMPQDHLGCLNMFRKRDCLIHPTVMFRRSYFDKAGLYLEDTYFGEDTMMWANGFANNCVFANIPEYLLYFRLDNNFFERRRGWKHAKAIFLLRRKVNRLLEFSFKEDIYACLYALAKLMPTKILNILYKILR